MLSLFLSGSQVFRKVDNHAGYDWRSKDYGCAYNGPDKHPVRLRKLFFIALCRNKHKSCEDDEESGNRQADCPYIVRDTYQNIAQRSLVEEVAN